MGARLPLKSSAHATEYTRSSSAPARLTRGTALVGAAIFFLALAVRVAYLIDSADYPAFAIPISDAQSYDERARALLAGQGLTSDFFWQPPLYPILLAVLYLLSDGSVVAAKFMQAGLGAVTCLLTWHLGKRMLGRTAGVLAGLITAAYGPLVFYETDLVAAGLGAFWSVLLLILLLGARARPRLWRCLALGLCGGLAVLTRSEFFPFLLASGLWLM